MKKFKIFSICTLLVMLMFVGFSCSDSGTGGDNGDPQVENPNDDQDNDDDQNDDGDDNDDSDDDGSGETTVEEDKEHIELSIDNALSALEDLGKGDLSVAIETFLQANAGEVDAAWAEDMFTELEGYINTSSIEENHRFDFAAHAGTYTWNSGSQTWTKTSASGQIVLHFPSSSSSNSNDVTVTLSEYDDTAVVIDGDGFYLPTSLSTKVELDGTEIFRFDLKEIAYSDNALPIPTALDIEIFTAPFTHQIMFAKNSNTEYQFSLTVDNNGTLVTGLDTKLTLAHSDYNNLDEDDFEMLTGTFNLTQDLAIDFSGEIGTLAALDDPSENQINSLVTAEVLYQDTKIGDLEYSAEAENVIIIYKDGSSETVDRYYERFAEELELIFHTYTGDWVSF
ncbi:hypothetical protein NC796_07220 [Aliifodinibius sp. S!AR15-10]|uniref:hypothetical protein n=1 Tax=Aliifodinibius sp. S!AR15-10 TaxID=2950437 RepID=UPI00285889FF|nr:hypothetical protein [Aliifodinibius sp. S!AR15-10]MDR8390921.1 hypothetical protein [Aliifodinibius sp. S!AR15-10]